MKAQRKTTIWIGIATAICLAAILIVPVANLTAKERWKRTVDAANSERWEEFLGYFPAPEIETGIDRETAIVLLRDYVGNGSGWTLKNSKVPWRGPLSGRRTLHDLNLTHGQKTLNIATQYEKCWTCPFINRHLIFGVEQRLSLNAILLEVARRRFPHPEAGSNESLLALYEFLLSEQHSFISKGANSLYERWVDGRGNVDLLTEREEVYRKMGVRFEKIAAKYGRKLAP